MRAKERAEARRAQLTESSVLAVAVAWSSWLASSYFHDADARGSSDALLALLPRMLQALNVMAIAASARALLAARPVSKSMEELSRHERDSGLVVGCILPPIVLLSRFLVAAHGASGYFSNLSLLHTWTSMTASISLLTKIFCFGSSGVLPTLVVDVIFSPAVYILLGIEADFRFMLPTAGRIAIALVFRFGRIALKRSFTVGEAMIVAQCVGLGIFDLILISLAKFDDESTWISHLNAPWHLNASSDYAREPHQLALQIGIVGALLICVGLTPLLASYGSSSPHAVAPPLPWSPTMQFITTLLIAVAGVIYPWSYLLLETKNPVAWLIDFLLESSPRWQLIGYWLVCLAVCVPTFTIVSRTMNLRQIIARKLFHLLVVVMFVPAFFASPEMLSLSYGVAFAVFCIAECARAVSLPPFGHIIAEFVQPFIDHREGGRVILTHTYLLLGCAMPLWFAHSTASFNGLAANAGVLALGIGDAMGAVVGSTFGRRKLFGHKTFEGTIAVVVSLSAASLVLHNYHVDTFSEGTFIQMILLIFGVILTSLLEASTAQIDNLVLSLFLFMVTNLVSCHS